jgi:hypothetical protein
MRYSKFAMMLDAPMRSRLEARRGRDGRRRLQGFEAGGVHRRLKTCATGKTVAGLVGAGLVSILCAVADDSAPVVDLGVTADPPAGTAVLWKATTSLRNGSFAGMVQGKAGESRIESVEAKEIKTEYLSMTERTITVVNSKTSQTETVGGKEQKTETTTSLGGTSLRAGLKDGKWVLEFPAKGERSAQQRAELQKLESRLNAPPNLFEGIKARSGEKFSVDPLRFLKQAGYTDVVRASGKIEARIKEVTERFGEPAAIVMADLAVQATLEEPDGARRSLAMDGPATFVHSLKTGLDFSVELSAKLRTSGLMLIAPGSFAPFSLEGDLKFDSTREYIKP